jgi:3-oxoacyl-[acyl-carrier protein] reductase
MRVNVLQRDHETAVTQKLSDEVRVSRLADVPLGRFGQLEEVVQVALFLASDTSSYLSGVTSDTACGGNI